ncbi:MAG: hypothetical protein AAGI30_12120 [Planctomycetota bacterium]
MPSTPSLLLTAALLSLAAAGPLAAQERLNCASASGTIDAASRSRLATFIASRLEDVGSTNVPARVDEARAALLEPLNCPDVSESFRRAFAELAESRLASLAAADDVHQAVAALMVAGACGVPQSAEVVMRPALDEQRPPAIRFAAAQAYQRMIAQLATDPVPERRQDAAVAAERAIGPALTTEQHPLVASALLDALLEGEREFDLVYPRTLVLVAGGIETIRQRGVPRRASEDDAAEWARTLTRAIARLQQPMLNPQMASEIDRDQSVLIAGAAADGLAFVRDRLKSLPLDDAEHDALRTLVEVAEPTLGLAHRALTNDPPAGDRPLLAAFDEAIEDGGGGPFQTKLSLDWTRGVLTRPPFDFPVDRFD